MEYVVTLVGGTTYEIPATAIETQRKVQGGKIQSILPKNYQPPKPEELPSAVTDFEAMKTKDELVAWAIDNHVPPNAYKDIKNIKQLRKKLKEYDGQ